jgi:hypothetical protein
LGGLHKESTHARIDVHHVRVRRIKAQDDERSLHGGVSPGIEWEHLKLYTGAVCQVGELIKLLPHNLSASDNPPDGRLIDHGPQPQRVGSGHGLLPIKAHRDSTLDCLCVVIWAGGLDHCAGICGGLEDPRNELLLICAHLAGFGLESDVGAVLGGQDVGVDLPPPALTRLAGEGNQRFPALTVDVIDIQQMAKVCGTNPAIPFLPASKRAGVPLAAGEIGDLLDG